jgi:hypothetical protein
VATSARLFNDIATPAIPELALDRGLSSSSVRATA